MEQKYTDQVLISHGPKNHTLLIAFLAGTRVMPELSFHSPEEAHPNLLRLYVVEIEKVELLFPHRDWRITGKIHLLSGQDAQVRISYCAKLRAGLMDIF